MFNTPRQNKKKQVEQNNKYQPDGDESDENYGIETEKMNNLNESASE